MVVVALVCSFLRYVLQQEAGLITTVVCTALALGYFVIDWLCKQLRRVGAKISTDAAMSLIVFAGIILIRLA